jgi:predicted metal-dependent peptidase
VPDDPADGFARIERAAVRQTLEENAARALAAARARLVLGRDARSAFFACLALRLVPEADWLIGTMATDGKVLAYHPGFVTGLSPDELVGVVAHEVMHNALAHHARRGVRDPGRWNVACDLAVNPVLLGAGFVLPKGRLVPGEGRYAGREPGKSAEEYYAALPDPSSAGPGDDAVGPGDEPGYGEDPGGCGGVRPPASADPAESARTEAEWKVAVSQAEQAAKGRGELPAGLARSVDDVVRPAADWKAVLREFVSSSARNDYSWSRPNRRFVARGLYLPGLRSEELGDMVLAVDTSGSVGPGELAVFAAEADAILAAFDCNLTVVYHDTLVQKTESWQSSDGPLTLNPVGGGGTSHGCVFDWLAAAGLTPACVVCLTDLDTEFPPSTPDIPVLWAVVGGNPAAPPFGTRVAVGG